MKKLIITLFLVILSLSASACKNEKTDSSSPKETDNTSKTQQEQTDKPAHEFDAQKILDEIIAGQSFSDMTEYEDVMFAEVLYEVAAEDVKQFAMYLNDTGISADEIIIIEAVDPDAAKRVFEKISNWYTSKAAQMKDYIPEEYEKIQKSGVKSSGNVIYMAVCDDSEAAEKIIEKYL